jgi:hypothetical protein
MCQRELYHIPIWIYSQGIAVLAIHSVSSLPGQYGPNPTPKMNPREEKATAIMNSRLRGYLLDFCFKLFHGYGSSNKLTSSSCTILLQISTRKYLVNSDKRTFFNNSQSVEQLEWRNGKAKRHRLLLVPLK